MIRNVLLMLSTDQLPDPVEEIQWHERQCARDGVTAVATTRVLTGLTPERSTVAFYGNQALANRYLGRGTFVEYVPYESARPGDRPREPAVQSAGEAQFHPRVRAPPGSATARGGRRSVLARWENRGGAGVS
jgi:hypothetical protein